LRADIRAEQKANWDYWANRVTLALALIGSIFGVLATANGETTDRGIAAHADVTAISTNGK
jgi:hypothetical protein